MPVFTVATCQFVVSADIRQNARRIAAHMQAAAEAGAQVVHFSECALSGYAGQHFTTWDGFDWEALEAATGQLMDLARRLRLWLVMGSSHRLSEGHLPHNSLYVIGPRGRIAQRYDKLFCTRRDLRYYTPGDYFATFKIDGLRCGLLICHDVRYPELYREYYRRGVRCLFQSFENAGFPGRTIHTVITRPTLQAMAADNYMWISASNACGYYQAWPSVFITPDGTIAGTLRQHRVGMMLNTVDTRQPFKDKVSFRARAMAGVLHSGNTVSDPRSGRRDAL